MRIWEFSKLFSFFPLIWAICPERRTRSNGLKLQEGKFGLDDKESFLTVREFHNGINKREKGWFLPCWGSSNRGTWGRGSREGFPASVKGVGLNGLERLLPVLWVPLIQCSPVWLLACHRKQAVFSYCIVVPWPLVRTTENWHGLGIFHAATRCHESRPSMAYNLFLFSPIYTHLLG